MADAARDLPGVTLHDLYEAYPDFGIDIPREQALLAAHHTIVFQHPFFWYSTPALLKEWQDLVLTFGWAYGPGGTALRGKELLTATSTGGPQEAYSASGYNGRTVPALLAPIAQTARLCGMAYLPPLVIHGAHRLDESGISAAAGAYRGVLEALRDRRLDPTAVTEEGALDAGRAVRGAA